MAPPAPNTASAPPNIIPGSNRIGCVLLVLFSSTWATPVRLPVSYWSRSIATGVFLAVGAISFYLPIYIEATTRVPKYWQAAEELGNMEYGLEVKLLQSGLKPLECVPPVSPEHK
jgi:hypothetical protein